MEGNRQVVLATETYGSGESWEYVAQDGAMERRRDGRDGASGGGNYVIGVFKVSSMHIFPSNLSL